MKKFFIVKFVSAYSGQKQSIQYGSKTAVKKDIKSYAKHHGASNVKVYEYTLSNISDALSFTNKKAQQ